MSDHQAQRHAAAMLVHNIGSGIEALKDLSPSVALENLDELEEQFLQFGRIILRFCKMQTARNEQLRTHQ